MIVSGFHAVGARLRMGPDTIVALYVDAERRDARAQRLVHSAQAAGVKLHLVDSDRLDRMTGGRPHQGVVAEVTGALPKPDLDALLDRLAEQRTPPLLLLLDGVTDPRNLGACLRAADGAGVHAVIAPRDRSAPLNEAAMQTAAGAAEAVPYLQITNLARTMRELTEHGIKLVGADDSAGGMYHQADLSGPIGIVMGAEGHGMRRLTREHCDVLVRIPMLGSVSSLNVSVATGVVLYEVVRQRSLGTS